MQEFNAESIFKIDGSQSFNECAIELFHFQTKNNQVYAEYLDRINKLNLKPTLFEEIPFLPIEFFKSKMILCGNEFETIFTSSGTEGMQSKHFVFDDKLYEEAYLKGFESFYGNPSKFTYLCLLPSYLERDGSSLITMAQGLINLSNDDRSGFFLYEHEELAKKLQQLAKENKPTILLGVSYALLDFANQYQMGFSNLIVMETGGMKGRREEITRQELHSKLQKAFNTKQVHSEYGMTELLSQAYAVENGLFQTPPWMKVLRRDSSDPLSVYSEPGSGALNIIDLANVYSCSFIATDDLGELHKHGKFTVLGRMDNSDIRGCNLLLSENM